MAPPTISFIDSPTQLDDTRTIYIPDTNVILAYPFFIPDPLHPTFPDTAPDFLSHAHIVISSLVNNELDCLKGQHLSISHSAANVIGRLDALTENYFRGFSLENAFELKNNLRIEYTDEDSGQDIDLLFGYWCVNSDLAAPPFFPDENDADGKIIASVLNIKNSGWYNECTKKPPLIVLSNDRNFRVRCRLFGLEAQPFNAVGSDARYSGRRTVNAPRNLYNTFIRTGEIPGNLWRQFMPNEPPFYPNEFIVFRVPQPKPKPQNPPAKRSRRKRGRPQKPTAVPKTTKPTKAPPKTPSERFNYIGRYDAQTDSIVSLKYLDRAPVPPENIGQAIHAEAMMDPQIGVVVVDNTPHYNSKYVATISYRSKEPAFSSDIYDKFNFN